MMSDITLAFERTGSGPPLIILHGLFGSSANWRSIAQCLTKSYAVDRVDLRNHGASPWHDTMDYLDMADDVSYFHLNPEVHSLKLRQQPHELSDLYECLAQT